MTDEKLTQLLDILRQREETVTCAESCTGGLLSGRITDIPGSSDVFRQAFITYCDEAKHQMLGVNEETLQTYTAVSCQCAREMALGAQQRAGAAAALSVTGYAGQMEDPSLSGLVYIGCAYQDRVFVREFHFAGERLSDRRMAVEEALKMLAKALEK